MGRLFGTDGIRGVANTKELDSGLAFKTGQAAAYVLAKHASHRPKILIGKDTRASGDMLEAGLTAGICSVGADVVSLGVVPTPAVAYLTRLYNADAGIVISASHNPMEYNGIKIFNSNGYKLSDEIENEIEGYILGETKIDALPTGGDVGKRSVANTAVADYINFAVSTINTRLDGMRICVDCANGASSVTAKDALEKLGADVMVINNTPDGTNINKNCGSTHLEQLSEFTTAQKADIGIAFDGDADRMLAIDENGKTVDGDQIMAICANEFMKEGKLKKNTLVATIMSNLGLFIAGKSLGINIPQTKVGDRYVLEKMLEEGYCLGGEQSGHVIFLDFNTTGDGLISALQLLSIVKRTGKTLSELACIVNILPQVLCNAKVKNENKERYMENETVKAAVKELEAEFADAGRVLIRPSGTEPLVRVMIEGEDIDYITAKASALAELIENLLS